MVILPVLSKQTVFSERVLAMTATNWLSHVVPRVAVKNYCSLSSPVTSVFLIISWFETLSGKLLSLPAGAVTAWFARAVKCCKAQGEIER